MKLTKRILSLCLALAMLLTVATFPAFAEEYTPKTIGLEASVRSTDARYDGALFLARPSDDVYVNDSLTIADNQTITIPANVYRGSSGEKIYLTSDTSNSDTIAQITGFEVIYGQNINDMWHKAYVKVDENGVMSGFYSDKTFATTKDITFTTAGTYLFAIQNYVDATGTLQNLKKVKVSWDQFDNRDNSYMWAVNVKDPANQLNSAPSKSDYTIDNSGDILNQITQGSAAVTATEGNLAYTEDIVPEGLTVDTRATDKSYWDKNFTITKADNTATIVGPASGLRIDFTDISYVDSLVIKRYQYDTDFKYDVYGSLDGETWYLIGDANRLGVRSGDSTYTISVDAVVKHLRVYYRDEVTACGHVTYNISEITGQIGVEYIGGSEEPTTVDVTFVDVDGANDNVVKTIDAGATVTIPDAYATGYKFYADEECTEEVDLATETFDADTTIYVKAIPVTPDPEQPTGPKTIGIEASIRSALGQYGGVHFLARPSDYNLKAGDKLTIAANQKITIAAGRTIQLYFTGDDSNSDVTAQVTGLVVRYGRSYNEQNANKVYVKVAADGTISGFYASMDDTTTTDIVLEEGIYIFSIQHYVDGAGAETKLQDMKNNINHLGSGQGPNLWSVEVKPADAPDVTAPDKADYNITTGTAEILSSIQLSGLGVSATTGNRAYVEEVFGDVNQSSSDADAKAKLYAYEKVNADTNTIILVPFGQLRFDFESVSYVNELKVKTDQWNPTFVYDVYGSLNGEDWYLIGEEGQSQTVASSVLTVSVDAVVKHLRVYYRDYSQVYGKMEQEITSFKGQLGVEYIGGSSEPQVKDESGNVLFEEITDDVLATLPSYFKVSGKNYVVKSWTMDGEAIDYVALKALTAADVTGDIVPELVEVPFDVAKLSKDATKSDKDDTAFDEGAKYVNGLYIQGAQIRFPETNVTAGLRFVNVVDRELEATLESLVEAGTISNLSRGTLAIGGVNYDNVDLTVANTGVDNDGKKIYKTADLFDGEYYKYTLCVTGFQPEQYELSVYVRPYITFTYGTETVYLYGEQYKTNYKAVVEEAVRVGGLTPEQLSYCNDILG